LVFNSPTLKGGAIDVRDIQGFSPIGLICDTFLRLASFIKTSKMPELWRFFIDSSPENLHKVAG